jgi:hypothetical protein
MFDGWASFGGWKVGKFTPALEVSPDQLRGNINRHWIVWQHFLYQDRGQFPCVFGANWHRNSLRSKGYVDRMISLKSQYPLSRYLRLKYGG